MEVEVAVLGSPSLIVPTVSVDVKQHNRNGTVSRAQELCESRGGRPGLPVPIEPHGFCGRKATLNCFAVRALELCESRGGRPGLPVPNNPYCLCGRNATLNFELFRGKSPGEGLGAESSQFS